MQQNYRFNIDGWLLIWKVRNALFCETSNMTFHEGSLKNNFGPWKVLDCKTVGFFLKISKEIGKVWRKSLTRP